jgi:hypothetical protein
MRHDLPMSPDPTSSSPDSKPAPRAEPPAESPEEAVNSAREKIAELVDYLGYYLVARIDALKFGIKKRIFIACFIAVAVVAGAGVIVTAVALLCEGICDGLSELFGRRWLGELVTGALLSGGTGIAAFVILRRLIEGSHLKIRGKYEALRRRQRQVHGHDVSERAGAGGRHG